MLNRPDVLINVILVIVAALMGYLGLMIWHRRETLGVGNLFWVMLSGLIWSIFYLLEIRAGDLSLKLFWAKAKYLGIVMVPVFWFLFVIEYVGYRQRLWPYAEVILFILPALTLLMVLTNGWHQLFFRSPEVQPCGNLSYLLVEHRFFFWLHIAYSNLLLAASFAVLIHALIRSRRFYQRMQVVTMIVAALFPWIGNFLYLTRSMPCVLRDPTPFAFLLSGIVVAFGALRFRWLNLVPVAQAVVLETMQDGVIVVNGQQRILDLNPAATEMLGATPRDVIGESISNLLLRWSEIADDALWTGEEAVQLTVGAAEDARIYEVRVSPLGPGESRRRRSGYVVMFHDVTEHVQALQEHEQLIHDLDAFAHMVAHDIKNPVGTIVTAASLFYTEYDRLPREELKQLAEVFRRAGAKAETIISNLLVLAGVQKVQSLDASPLDMQKITSEALRQLEDPIARSGANINLPDTWPTALGNKSWVEQVWVNYLSNAIKYGGRPPEITLGADRPKDGMVRFWVEDNGAGLDEIEAQRIFEPFTRLTEMHITGYGVGLSIVKRIVERLGGEVGADCEIGEGCQFYFTLPAAEAASADAA